MDPGLSEENWARLIELLGPVHDAVRGTARRLARDSDDGDDLFQEALLRAWRKLPDLRDPSRFRGWFHAVLLSVHRSRSRRSFWRRFLSLEGAMERGFDPPGPAAVNLDDRDRAERVSRALATLPAVQREAVVLFELERFPIEEIAALQGVSLSAVKSRLQRGRERLRRFYERLEITAGKLSRSPDQPASKHEISAGPHNSAEFGDSGKSRPGFFGAPVRPFEKGKES